MSHEHDPRPRPQYGEYAAIPLPSEQSEQTTTHASGETVDATQGNAEAELAASFGEASPAQSVDRAPSASYGGPRQSTPGPIPGVPHNLGAGNDRQPFDQARASEPQFAQQPNTPSHVPATEQPKPKGADRIVTIILLVIGGYSALSLAFTLMQLPMEFARIADALQLENYSAPASLGVLGTVGAVLVLALFAFVVIFSLRRLRARKMTFWVPLVAGVVSWIIFFIVFFVGVGQSPELWNALLASSTDPQSMQELLDRINSNG